MTNSKAYAQQWRDENRDHVRAYTRDFQKRYKNPKKKDWHRDWHLRASYGISLAEYNALLAKQDGACGICGRKPPFGKFEHLSVDHDHTTGLVRGLLCGYCNSFLGRIQDDISKVTDYMGIKKKMA